MKSVDKLILDSIFQAEGASELDWEVASRCDCFADDSHQPNWNCQKCGGFGAIFADPVRTKGLFRSQSRWVSWRVSGELDHGEATLTTPLEVEPGYTDHRVRDRLTVVQAVGDLEAGRVFYPSGPATPFLFANEHLAWRVQLQAAEQRDRVVPQP